MLELEAPPPPRPSANPQAGGRKDAEMHTIQWHHPHCKRKMEIRGGAPRCFSGQSWPGRCNQPGARTFANAASQPTPSSLGWWGQPLTPLLCLALLEEGIWSCLFLRSRPLILEELSFPTLISHRSGLCTLPRDHFTF